MVIIEAAWVHRRVGVRATLTLCVSLLLGGLASFATAAEPGAQPKAFALWLVDIREQAIAQGISAATVDAAFVGVEPDQRVLRADSRQPEFVQTFEQYLQGRVTPARAKAARVHYKENQALLERIAERYQIDAPYLIAFWALESNFGRLQGNFSIIRSLATLAHDQRRSAFFTRELMAALQVLDEGHVPLDEFVGGWAGAMGQNQFMPSSFLNFAQDFDGDGKKNIWSNTADVWASIAYYLSENKWQAGESWGMSVSIAEPVEFSKLMPMSVTPGCRALRHHTRPLSLVDWSAKGIVPAVEQAADPRVSGRKYAMVVPQAGETVGYLVGKNFRTILSYNCANKYAVSIGLLADMIVADSD
ncbi:MAG: membrane-bound lytic murein transglycosylase B [Urechidicola sp.]|jgi:membrane-bound lytic murein transglycosylase B